MLDLPPQSLQPRDMEWILVKSTIAPLALQPALPIHSAITIIRIRTMHHVLPEQDMPHILQHSPSIVIIHLGIQQPFSDPYVDLLFVFVDSGSSNCELRTAGCSYGSGDRKSGKEVMQDRGIAMVESREVILFYRVEIGGHGEVYC